MVSAWALLLSLVVLAFTSVTLVYVVGSRKQPASVLALDAAIATLLGVALNVVGVGELRPRDRIVFCALPPVLAASAWALAYRFPDRSEPCLKVGDVAC